MKQYERDRLGLQDDFMYMSCRVATVDDRSAIDAAYRNIKYGLGVLNLITLAYGVSKRFGIPNTPIGKFISASTIFTIDRRQRKLGNYVSENHYPISWKRNFLVWQRASTKEITKHAKHYALNLARLDFREKVVQAIVLFQEGLEATHIDLALLKFWTGIEVLCAREEREPAERTVERASSIFINRSHAAMRLNFIQEFRNKIVHRGNAGEHALLCAQWGSIYLAGLIEFCLFNKYKFQKRSELLDYLSAPTDQVKLAKTISLYRRRLSAVRECVEQ